MLNADQMAQKIRKYERTLYEVYGAIRPAWEARNPLFDIDKQRFVPTSGGGEDEPITVLIGDKMHHLLVKDCGFYKPGSVENFVIHESKGALLAEMVDGMHAAKRTAPSEVRAGASITKQGEADVEKLPDGVAEALEQKQPQKAKG